MQRTSKHKGFTIVELLIVVVVIAILAAITIVAYNGIQNRTYDSAVQSDLSTFFKKMENYKADNATGRYPTPLNGSDMDSILSDVKVGFKFSTSAYSSAVTNNIAYCFTSDGSEFGMVALSRSGNAFFVSTSSGGIKPYTPAWTSTAASTCKNADANLSVIKASATPGNVWARTSGGWNYGI